MSVWWAVVDPVGKFGFGVTTSVTWKFNEQYPSWLDNSIIPPLQREAGRGDNRGRFASPIPLFN